MWKGEIVGGYTMDEKGWAGRQREEIALYFSTSEGGNARGKKKEA